MAGSPSEVSIEVLAGARVRVTSTFTPLGSTTPADPTTVTFKTYSPAGATTTLVYGTDAAVVKYSAGVYYLDVIASTRGIWWVQAKGSGATGINVVTEVAIKADAPVIA